MKGVGMLVGNFELNPLRRATWAWPKRFLTPKRDEKNIHIKYTYQISNIHIKYTYQICIFIFFRVQP